MFNYRQVNYSPVMIYCGYWPLFWLDFCHFSRWQWKIMLQIGCQRKEKFSLKFKSGIAAFLGKLQDEKTGEKLHYLCTPTSHHSGVELKLHWLSNPWIHICPHLFVWYQATASCHKLWIPWNRVYIWIDPYQHHSQVQSQLVRNCSWASFTTARVF